MPSFNLVDVHMDILKEAKPYDFQ